MKHSNVFYIYKGESGFEAVDKATACKNDFGLDLFRYKGNVYEGRSGLRFITEAELFNLDFKIHSVGGIDKMTKHIEQQILKTGESPRYTRPDERKQDIFPPDPEKENTVFAKDVYGKKHYYYRFFNENGIELFTLKNAKESYRTVFVECEGYMLGIDQHHRLEEALKWLAELENGVKGEVERLFNESMANPQKIADMGFANILGRVDEAKAHNAPIREARERENQQRDAEREAKRFAEEQAAKAEYAQAIKTAERKILSRDKVINEDIQDKSLIMQLFREHEIAVPLKTQGWIINSLHDIYYNEDREHWSYHYTGNDSTVFNNYLPCLVSAIQASDTSAAAGKKLRLILFEDCKRSCSGCCNKDFNLAALPVCHSFKGYELIMLTGGEPMLNPEKVYDTIKRIRQETDAPIILYTAHTSDKEELSRVISLIDGITVTLHDNTDTNPFLEFDDYHMDMNRTKSYRLNVFKGVEIDLGGIKGKWKVKSDIEWIKDCPLPDGEVLMRLEG